MRSFPERYNDPKKPCGQDPWQRGLKKASPPSALVRLRFFFIPARVSSVEKSPESPL